MANSALPRPIDRIWAAQVEAWDRGLRARNKSYKTRLNYELAATQLGDYLAEVAGTGDLGIEGLDAAAADPTDVTKAHLEVFIGWMIETRSASTAANKFRALQQFYRYLLEEDEIDRSPFEKMKQPKVPKKLIPILHDEQLSALIADCKGRAFIQLRDEAIVRVLIDTGGRLTEITNQFMETIDTNLDIVRVDGKGAKQRGIPFGAKTALALSRYARARAKQKAAHLPAFWLSAPGTAALEANGVKLMLKRRGKRVGLPGLHAHQFRHTFAHNWLVNGGNETDLMRIMGWSTRDMVGHYAESAADHRAHEAHRSLALGDRL